MLPKGVENIFRLYDVRGVYGREITPDVMSRIGLAVSHYFQSSYAVGMDLRASSPLLRLALLSGLLSGGSDAIDVGAVPIGAVMYMSIHKGYAAAYVSASHLPAEWNGVKLFRRGGDPMVGEDIFRIKHIFFSQLECRKPGRYARYEVLPEYEEFLLSKAPSSNLKVVIDCGNGAASLIAPRLLRDAGFEVYALNADPDPRFPGRGSEPTPERLAELREEVVKRKAHFGVALDGDGDRVVFVDETGKVLSAEQAAAVMLEGVGFGDVVANVDCSMVIEELVSMKGYKVYRVPVGRTFVAQEVLSKGAILGVESSGHYVTWNGCNLDDGLLSLLYFAKAVSQLGRASQAVPPLYPTYRVKVEVPDEHKEKVMEVLKEELTPSYTVELIDGVKVKLEKGWVLVRPSNTEPVIRVTSEAVKAEDAKNLAEKFAAKIKDIASVLSRCS